MNEKKPMLGYLKNISLYSMGEVLNKSIQFLLLPVYAHFLTPKDYGRLELTYLYGAVLLILYGFIVENGYARLFFDKKEQSYRDSLFGTSFFFKLATGAVFLGVSLVFSEFFGKLLFNFEKGAEYIQLISISVLLKSLAEIPLKTLIIEKRAMRFVINNSLYLLVSLSTTVYFIVVLRLKISGVLYGQILGAVFQLATLLYSEWKRTHFSFSFSLLKGMLYFSIFLIPTHLASFVTFWSNRLFLLKYANLEDVGTFSFGYKIASIIPILLTQPIKKASGPEIYELIDQPEACRKRIRQYTLIMLMFLSLFALTLSVFSREMIQVMAAKSFASSYQVVFILSMGYVLVGLAGIVVTPIQISKKTWLISITWALSAAVNIALNLLLVPCFGKAGATYATLLSFLFILVLYFIFAEMVYRVRFEYIKYSSILLLVSAAYYLLASIQSRWLLLDLSLKGIGIVITVFLMFTLFVSAEDRLRLRGMLAAKLSFLKIN